MYILNYNEMRDEFSRHGWNLDAVLAEAEMSIVDEEKAYIDGGGVIYDTPYAEFVLSVDKEAVFEYKFYNEGSFVGRYALTPTEARYAIAKMELRISSYEWINIDDYECGEIIEPPILWLEFEEK